MKVAYITKYNSDNIHEWSGLGYYIYEALKEAGVDLVKVGNLKEKMRALFLFKSAFYKFILHKNHLLEREPFVIKRTAKQLEAKLKNIDVDLLFGPGTLPFANLTTDLPIAIWTDSTFAGMTDFYPRFTNMEKNTLKHGNEIESRILDKCKLAVFSSDWAAKSAIENYHISPDKVKVVPFGANIENNLTMNEIKNIIDKKNFNVCKLLFIGVDWHRKGGDIAFEIFRNLQKAGLTVELNVVGCKVPKEINSNVINHGFVSKNNSSGKELLAKLFIESHFFVLPSRAECFGVVFCEASSYGLPSFASNVGGIPSAVRNDKNGFTFPLLSCADKITESILYYWNDKEKYRSLSLSSYNEYLEELNWKTSGRKVKLLLENI